MCAAQHRSEAVGLQRPSREESGGFMDRNERGTAGRWKGKDPLERSLGVRSGWV